MLARTFLIGLLALAIAPSALAQSAQAPAETFRAMGWYVAELRDRDWDAPPAARARQLARDLGGYLEAQADGGLHHPRSGRTCPALLGGWTLARVTVTASTLQRPDPGDDVGCTYLRARGADDFVTVHISTALMPNALQSLTTLAAALQQTNLGWYGWSVNMAPPFAPYANIAMTRGTTGPGAISDIWIATTTIEQRYWEFKFRVFTSSDLRATGDAIVREGMQRIAQVATETHADAHVPPLHTSGLLRWRDDRNAEASALEFADSGLACPTPPAATFRSLLSLHPTGEAVSCHYKGGDEATWAAGIARPVVRHDPMEMMQGMAQGPSMQIAWSSLTPLQFGDYTAAYGRGVATLPSALTNHTIQLVAFGPTWSFNATVFSETPEGLPTDEAFLAFARSIMETPH